MVLRKEWVELSLLWFSVCQRVGGTHANRIKLVSVLRRHTSLRKLLCWVWGYFVIHWPWPWTYRLACWMEDPRMSASEWFELSFCCLIISLSSSMVHFGHQILSDWPYGHSSLSHLPGDKHKLYRVQPDKNTVLWSYVGPAVACQQVRGGSQHVSVQDDSRLMSTLQYGNLCWTIGFFPSPPMFHIHLLINCSVPGSVLGWTGSVLFWESFDD